MKVICRKCNKIVDESIAIRMTIVEYQGWLQSKNPELYPIISISPIDYTTYTQICQNCYDPELYSKEIYKKAKEVEKYIFKHIEYQKFITEWCQSISHTSKNIFVKVLRTRFNDGQIMFILETIDNICTNCWNNMDRCYCMNDE